MRGGKREGAGRKRKEPTKMYRLPVRLEAQIKAMLENESHDRKLIQKSIEPIFPTISKEQNKRLRIWLGLHGFAKTQTEARKMTHNPKATKETVLKYSEISGEKYYWSIGDIMELYAKE